MSATATLSSAPPSAAPKLSERIGRIEISATMAVTAAAAKLRAEGAKLVDFGAGEPHFATPGHIKDAAIAAVDEVDCDCSLLIAAMIGFGPSAKPARQPVMA